MKKKYQNRIKKLNINAVARNKLSTVQTVIDIKFSQQYTL